MATTLRFVVLDEHKGNGFAELQKSIDKANKSIGKNNQAMKAQSSAATTLQGKMLGLVGAVSGFGDAQGAASSKSSLFAKGLAAVNLATGVLEPALAGVIVATGALAGALVAGGAGLGAYGLVLKNVGTQLQKLKQLQTAAATGSKPAQKALQAFVKTLSPALKNFAGQLEKTKQQYADWSKTLEAPVLHPLTLALKFVKPALTAISPLVRAAAGAVKILVGQMGQLILSPRFAQQVQVLLPHVRPAILGLAHAFGNVAAGIFGVVKAFLPMSDTVLGGVTKLTAKFKEWGQSLPSHSGFQSLMNMFRTSTPKAVAVLKNLAEIIKNVAAATVGLATPANSQALLNILGPLTQIIAQLSKNQALVRFVIYALLLNSALKKVSLGFTAAGAGLSGFIGAGRGLANLARGFNSVESAAAASTGTMGTLGGKLKTVKSFVVSTVSALAATSVAWAQNTAAMVASKAAAAAVFVWQKLLTAGQWLLDVALSANPIGLIVIALAALGAAFYLAWTKSATFRKILIATWNDIWKVTSQVVKNVVHAAGNFWHALVFAFSTVRTWVKKNWPWLLGVLTGPVGLAVVWIIKHWSKLIQGIRDTWNKVIAFIRKIPGWVLQALASFGKLLVNRGHDLINGLWNGIKNIWNRLVSWFRGMPGRVNGFFRGALSWLLQAGKNVIWGLWNGLQSIWHKVTSFISGIGGWIKSHKGPIPLDRALLVPAGKAIMKGLHVGLLGGAGGPLGFISGLAGTIGGLISGGLSGLFGGGGGVGGGVARWSGLVLRALSLLGQPRAYLGAVLHRIAQESGGNPRAINLWDINAQRGDPSRGLMQTIGSTFAAYAGPFRRLGIYNPFANIFAGLNYALHAYPGRSLASVMLQPGGYAKGTKGAAPGWAWVGERGPELVRMRGGETVLPHAASRMVAGYAKGTKDTIAEQVHKALRVLRRRPHLPELIARLQKRLGKLTGRIVDERQLAGHVHGAARRRVERELHRDVHHRRLMRRRLRDATHDRGIVEHAGHSLAARDRRLVDAITAAHRRHMPKVARRLQNQLSDDKGILHRLHRWLSQVTRERARQAKERAARKAAEKAAEAAAKAARANNKVIRAYIRLSGAGWSAQARQAAATALGMTGPMVFDRGGWLMPGATLAVNNTGRPEPVGTPGGHVTYNITVNVPPHANQASIGRQIVHSIQQFEKSSGTRWRK